NIYKRVNGEMVQKGEPIYPSRFGKKAIEKLKMIQGPYIF
ncbi:unnamed protein product, partial [marine sediment metagenome]